MNIHVKITSCFTNASWEGEIEVRRDGLEDLFRYFNRVDEADCERLEALGYDLPSLSVGDLLELDDVAYVVAPLGFSTIEASEWTPNPLRGQSAPT